MRETWLCTNFEEWSKLEQWSPKPKKPNCITSQHIPSFAADLRVSVDERETEICWFEVLALFDGVAAILDLFDMAGNGCISPDTFFVHDGDQGGSDSVSVLCFFVFVVFVDLIFRKYKDIQHKHKRAE